MSEVSAVTDESEAAEVPAPLSGHARLGKYALIEELGRGGMAVVYLAIDQSANASRRPLVIKVMRDMDGADSATWETDGQHHLDMFFNEAQLAMRLNHPNVVRIYDASSQDGKHIIAMEYLDGRPLNHILTRARAMERPLGLNAELRIMLEMLAGLHHAHELRDNGVLLGVVHRDVSPHNIFVTYSGHVKVLDFGIAKQANGKQHTEAGVLKGKISYMSPEQVADTPLDRRTDIFAAGIMLWEMLTGQYFWGDKNELQILHSLLNGFTAPDPRSINPALPERLSTACMKALAFSAEQRFATCEDFRQELLGILADLPPISTQQIGVRVSEMFYDVREKHRQNIVSRLAALDVAESGLRELRDQFSIPIPPVESTTGAGAWAKSATPAKGSLLASELTTTLVSGARSSRGVLALGLGLGAALLAFGLAWKLKQTQAVAEVPKVETAAATTKSEAASAPKTAIVSAPKVEDMMITLRVMPAEAKAVWDGLPMTQNPSVRRFKRDGSIYEARVEAPGYETKTVTIFLTGDQTFMLDLERDRRGRGRWVAPRKVAAAPAAPPEAAEPEPAPSRPKLNLDNDDPWK